MTRIFWRLGLAALVLGMIAGCEKQKGSTVPSEPGTGDSTSVVPDSLVLARTFPPLLANGVDHVTVYAMVVDAGGRGMSNVGVAFSTTQGTIEPFAETGADGIAQVELVSAASVQDISATVSAVAGTGKAGRPLAQDATLLVVREPVRGAVIDLVTAGRWLPPRAAIASPAVVGDVAHIPMTGITVSLQASPATIPADGISKSRLLATVMETTLRIPLAQQEVRFGASTGTIEGSAMTDASGVASALLTASPGDTDATITAYYGHTLSAQATVHFSVLTLSLETTGQALLADGTSSLDVIARLLNQERNPVVGARIDFSTDLGIVSSPVETGENGEAIAKLVAAQVTGTAHVFARFGSVLSRDVSVAFVSLPVTSELLLRVDRSTLPADGAAEAALIATATDASGDPMPDGTLVTFSVESGGGRIIAPTQLTIGGRAEATYVAGTQAGPVGVRAASGSATALVPLVLARLDAAVLTLSAVPAEILANGLTYSTLTAVVTDLFGHPVPPGTKVTFETSEGVLEADTPTDAAGIATAQLRSVPRVTGLGRVTARIGSLQKTVDVDFVSEAAAHIEAVRVDPPHIGVRGAGDHETATITFEVEDGHGIPVDAAHAVTLHFGLLPGDPSGTDATVWPGSAATNARGRTAATIGSGLVSGTVEVEATTGSLTSEPIRVAIHGDRPDPAHFSIFFEKVNVAGLVYAGLQYEVCAKVGDQHGNPVPDSTAVWFHADYGIIQGSAVTGSLGDACLHAETAAPWPVIPEGDGLVYTCARTVSKAGATIEACGNVMWSGPTIVEVTSPTGGFDVPNGGSIRITYRVRDANFNPLTSGTTVKVTASKGQLAGDADVLLPDTQDPGYTFFSVILIDDDPETDVAGAAAVTITVKSPNGNRSAIVTGTMH